MRRYLGVDKEPTRSTYKYADGVELNWPLPVSFLWHVLLKQGVVIQPSELMDIPFSMLEDSAVWSETEHYVEDNENNKEAFNEWKGRR